MNHKTEDQFWEITDFNDFPDAEEDIQEEFGDVFPEETEEEFLEETKEEKKINPVKEILGWVITFVVALLVALAIREYVIINASIPTGSMESVIMPNDKIFGNRLAYLKEGPERGDIVFFYYPDDESQKYVKRVIGLPGEKVVINEGKIYIDDSTEPLDEPYLKEAWVRGTGYYEFYVPEDSYLVLGDNRNNSWDARYWNNSYVHKDKIIGEAVYRYYPFNRMGILE